MNQKYAKKLNERKTKDKNVIFLLALLKRHVSW